MPHHESHGRFNGSDERPDAEARDEILRMLRDDHTRVKKAFREFDGIDMHESRLQGQAIVQQTCADLLVHMTLEEEMFYPAVRRAVDGALIDEAEVEHMTARILIDQLQEIPPDHEKYSATFIVLGEYVKHHIREEESELFPQLARARLDWRLLAAEMKVRREELKETFAPLDDRYDLPSPRMLPPPSRGRGLHRNGRSY